MFFFKLLIKHGPLPWVILHAVGIQLGSISGDTVAIITRCQQSLYSLYNFTALEFELCMYIQFYSSSKFMDFVKVRKDFRCSVISSCLLAGQFPYCWTFTLSSSLLVKSNVHR